MSKDISDMISDLNKIANNVGTAKAETIRKLLSDGAKEVKTRTPVDTGDLKGDWNVDISGDSGELTNTMEYAPYVEYGHKTRGGKSFVRGVFMLKDTHELLKSNMDFYAKYYWSKLNG